MKDVILLGATFAMIAAAQIPSPALLVLNKEGNVAIVDPKTRTVVGRAPTGEGPHEVEASSDGKLAFASNYGDGQKPGHSISVIDLASRKEIRRVDVTPMSRPHGLFFTDGKLYFTAEANKLIARYDPESNQVDWVLGTGQEGTHMVLVSPDRKTMFTSNIAGGSIAIIEGPKQTVVATGKGPEGFDLSPDGKEIWAANSGDGSVAIIDVASKKLVQTFDVQTKRSNRLKFTPDGTRALISDLSGGELVIVDTATRKSVKRLQVGRSPAGILVQPDGTRAYVAVTGDDNVAVIDLKTLEIAGRISTGKGPDGMAWIK
jgi:YVTN family beta-propeller protein